MNSVNFSASSAVNSLAQLDQHNNAVALATASHNRSLSVLELAGLGLQERVVPADGNGLFYAVIDQMRQCGDRLYTAFLSGKDPVLCARNLRDDAIKFAKHTDIDFRAFGYGSATAVAMGIGYHGNGSYDDNNVTATVLARMLDLNLVMVKAGQSRRLNDEAALRGLPPMTIVYDETMPDNHFNSTERIACSSSALPQVRL